MYTYHFIFLKYESKHLNTHLHSQKEKLIEKLGTGTNVIK